MKIKRETTFTMDNSIIKLRLLDREGDIKTRLTPSMLRRMSVSYARELRDALRMQDQLRISDIQTTFKNYYQPCPDEYQRSLTEAIKAINVASNKSTKEEKK